MTVAQELALQIGVKDACRAMEIPRATFYRRLSPKPAREPSPRRSHRALSDDEREEVLRLLNSDKYADVSPRQAYFDLLTLGHYVASLRTIYRILAAEKLVGDRRNQRRHPSYAKPVLVANAPNQVWTWDFTILMGPCREIYYLAVAIDLFSRYVVGWALTSEATAEVGQQLISRAMDRQRIAFGSLVIHSDRGSQMKCGSWSQLEESLGLVRSFSRPRVSDDNPFVEAHFKTLKYRPVFPARFTSLEDARGFCQDFFAWYNDQHYHSGISDLTPFSVHFGLADSILATRQAALDEAYARNPERFSQRPCVKAVPTLVGINHHAEVIFDAVVVN
jgi:putative transposase